VLETALFVLAGCWYSAADQAISSSLIGAISPIRQ
jgi:hypothetical protein